MNRLWLILCRFLKFVQWHLFDCRRKKFRMNGTVLTRPAYTFIEWCLGTGTVLVLTQDLLLFWQVSGELRCRVHPTSPGSVLSITSLSLPPELPEAAPIRNGLRRETRSVASRYLATPCRRRNLSALEPPQLTCSRLQLAPRPQSNHGVRVNLLSLGFDK